MKAKIANLGDLRTRQSVYGGILAGFSFLVLTLLTVKVFAPQVDTNAATQNAAQTVGPYTMSMANNDTVSIAITPTSSQAVYTAANNLSVTNTCSAGATITMTTASTTSNSLTRTAVNGDTLPKDIVATTSSSLDNNSWGFSKNSGSTYAAVPKKGETAATIYDASAAQTSALSVPVMFGVKTDNNMPSGAYTNDVVYTMTPKAGCLTYGVTWNFDGGTAKSGATYPTSLSWGATVNLSQLTPTRDGYTFAGWTNGSSNYTGNETAQNLNPGNATTVTVKAKWTLASYTKTFSYTGSTQTWTVPYTGNYKVELWGASGGTGVCTYTQGCYLNTAGKGAYTKGQINLNKNTSLYAYVGGQGKSATAVNTYNAGGWNGGGTGGNGGGDDSAGGGGGATDIRSVSGAWNNASSLRSRIMVASGGGGASCVNNGSSSLTSIITHRNGAALNNAAANERVYYDHYSCTVSAVTQTSGVAFGYGASGATTTPSAHGAGGGGAGWYGGGHCGVSDHWSSASGGTSYISGHTGAVAVTSTSSSSPKSGCSTGTSSNACSVSPYGYTFTSTQMIAGNASMPNTAGTGNETGHSGNGYAKITWLGV